jgi:hypothetical protein
MGDSQKRFHHEKSVRLLFGCTMTEIAKGVPSYASRSGWILPSLLVVVLLEGKEMVVGVGKVLPEDRIVTVITSLIWVSPKYSSTVPLTLTYMRYKEMRRKD